MTAAGKGPGIVFTFELVATAAESFGQGTGASTSRGLGSAPPPPAEPAAKPKTHGKSVIMIDPGHGGIDGGAVSGPQSSRRKTSCLAVAKELRHDLMARGRYDVRMTRTVRYFYFARSEA